ncbi:di-N-acetylchitobiase [Labeo rohita]|uniref:Di-N-acetylchitobiase n=1 Tax=Labeo rohita TaxID=84645 RepID=A0A498NUE6_LABRO|nr:di-N-acetylchitobiase [Labeo rohita]RXN35605.1 di-N-acetylchitobiase [Labeo rohita]
MEIPAINLKFLIGLAVTILTDIVHLGLYYTTGEFIHKGATRDLFRFSGGMAILSLLLKPVSCFFVYQMYRERGGEYNVNFGDVPLSYIVDPGNRTAWIQEKVQLAQSQFMDGINIDVEQAVDTGSPEYYALTALVKETTESFHTEIPGSQVSFDVAWSPKCIDKRCYDYLAIADSCDLLFVMSYDEQSQIWGDCIAMANAPFNQTLTAYDQYLSMSIDPQKLVMGVPWYGYDYSCLNFTKDGVCTIPKVPFRGAPCSDASGRQIPYSIMMKQINSSISGRLWDENQRAPYYNYKDTEGKVHQVWYDDPESIALKAAYVAQRGLKGIGMWNGNLLDYSDDPVAQRQTVDMWNALTPSEHRDSAVAS